MVKIICLYSWIYSENKTINIKTSFQKELDWISNSQLLVDNYAKCQYNIDIFESGEHIQSIIIRTDCQAKYRKYHQVYLGDISIAQQIERENPKSFQCGLILWEY